MQQLLLLSSFFTTELSLSQLPQFTFILNVSQKLPATLSQASVHHCLPPIAPFSYHCFVPYNRHPFFNAIGSLWNGGEVVFPNCFLCCTECTMCTSRDLEVPTGSETNQKVTYAPDPFRLFLLYNYL